MNIDTTYYERCIATLDKAYSMLQNVDPVSIEYDIYRSACIKEFEIILEQSGKLLKKALSPYFHSSIVVDRMYFKDVFRHAVSKNIISDEECDRWFQYRDSRNNTAHDYGENFAEETLLFLTNFILDSSALANAINQKNIN